MPAVSSIQRGSIAITSASGTAITQAITSVDLSRSIVTMTIANADNEIRDQRHLFSAYLSSATQITFTRGSASFAKSVTVEWEIVEFASSALQSLQTGSADPTAATTDIAIAAVDTASSVPILTFSTSQASIFRQSPRPTLEQTTVPGDTLRLTLPSTPSAGHYLSRWQLIEFKGVDASVQSGTTNVTGYSDTATISAVDTGKTLVAKFTTGGSTLGVRSNTRAYLASSTSLQFDVQPFGTAVPYDVTWYAVEMLDGSTVQSGTTTIAAGNTAPASNPTWTAMTNGHVFHAGEHSSCYVNSASDAFPQDVAIAVAMNVGQDGVSISRLGSVRDVALSYQAVDWADASGGATVIDLTAASMGIAGQAVQARLAASIALAALATSAQDIQTRLAANLTAASQPMSGQSISTTTVARLTTAAMGFAAQAIDLIRSTAINLTAATMRFVANPITVTGAIAAVVGSWIIQSRRRRR